MHKFIIFTKKKLECPLFVILTLWINPCTFTFYLMEVSMKNAMLFFYIILQLMITNSNISAWRLLNWTCTNHKVESLHVSKTHYKKWSQTFVLFIRSLYLMTRCKHISSYF